MATKIDVESVLRETTEFMVKPKEEASTEEKKHAGSGEDDVSQLITRNLMLEKDSTFQETMISEVASPPPSSPAPAKSTDTGTVSQASEAPTQTLGRKTALHSSAVPKVASVASKSKLKKDSSSLNDPELLLSPPVTSQTYHDDEDSSNDEDSYFADPNNLPSPGEAGRKYSFGSHHSTTKHNAARESDASLSLSDDSDEDTTTQNNNTLYVQQAPELFPQQHITRMHSVGSLVSTSSQNSEEDPGRRRETRMAGRDHANDSQNPPSSGGSLSPAQGPHLVYPMYGAHQPHHMNPPFMPDYRQYFPYQGFPHPQPHILGQQQQDHWFGPYPDVYPDRSGGWPNAVPYEEYTNAGAHPQENEDAFLVNSGKKVSRRSTRELTRKPSSNLDKPHQEPNKHDPDDGHFKVYWQRWIMLMYMSVLNLLSDWTCYSVAPIAKLTREAYGAIDPEQLVTIFLIANSIAGVLEPIILSRLGLRRTILFGALLLMVGSMVKSGGMPPITTAKMEKGHCETRIIIGFFLVGLSQPLYQCTPALLSASWFPERERTLATGVALNANQLGIGCAFIFGTLLVAKSDDIPGYFGLLSIISTVTFFGTLFQFDDAPPTPPSDSARVMRGTLEVNLPNVKTILQSMGVGGSNNIKQNIDDATKDGKQPGSSKSSSKHRGSSGKARRSNKAVTTRKSRNGPPTTEGSRRRSRNSSYRNRVPEGTREPKAPAPSAALWGPVSEIVPAPSPVMPGSVAGGPAGGDDDSTAEQGDPRLVASGYPFGAGFPGGMPSGNTPLGPPPMTQNGYPVIPPYGAAPLGMPGYFPGPPQGYPPLAYAGYNQFDPRFQYYPYAPMHFHPASHRGWMTPYGHQQMPQADQQFYSDPYSVLPPVEGIDAGAEPVLTITPHHLDIDIRDDQIILAIRACFARPGFVHSLVAFAVSGIVINTLSTYMDYLVRLNGAGREYTGIIGGSFQVVIMISSLIVGALTDKSRAYYSVTIGMLVIGAFGLAECGVSLNADRGSDLRVALIVVAALVGPLQPVSTELGVEVVYPLSENTVLVIQQLHSNLLSGLFIPLFKALKDIGIAPDENGAEQPEYTFSFYLLIVLHVGVTVFFATFNGRYLRYEHELQKKEEKGRKRREVFEGTSDASAASFRDSLAAKSEEFDAVDPERRPLLQQRHPLA